MNCAPVQHLGAFASPWALAARKQRTEQFNLKTAVGTTDFADNTDKEGIAVEGVFTRRVAAKEVLHHDEARSHPCYPWHPWFLNCRV